MLGIPSSAHQARVLLKRTALDEEFDAVLALTKRLRTVLDRSLRTLCPLPPDEETPVKPPPQAWSDAYAALATMVRGLGMHQRETIKIHAALLRYLPPEDADAQLTPEQEAEELEEMAREYLEAMSPEERARLLERRELPEVLI